MQQTRSSLTRQNRTPTRTRKENKSGSQTHGNSIGDIVNNNDNP